MTCASCLVVPETSCSSSASCPPLSSPAMQPCAAGAQPWSQLTVFSAALGFCRKAPVAGRCPTSLKPAAMRSTTAEGREAPASPGPGARHRKPRHAQHTRHAAFPSARGTTAKLTTLCRPFLSSYKPSRRTWPFPSPVKRAVGSPRRSPPALDHLWPGRHEPYMSCKADTLPPASC